MNILKAFVLTLTLFFAPIIPLILLVLFAIFLDTIFGVIAAKKTGENIESRKLGRIIIKSIIYISLLLLTYGIDYILLNELMMIKFGIPWLITKGAAVILCLVELFSIDEKIRLFNDNKSFKYYFKRLFKVAKNINENVKEIKETFKDKGEDKN